MEGKRVRDSHAVMAQIMNPFDANPAGNVHGGVIMKLIDTAGEPLQLAHKGQCSDCFSGSIGFSLPPFYRRLGNLASSLNFVGKTSMEVGIRVDSENLITGERHHVASAYMTFVALNSNNRPMPLPPLILETDDERRRNHEAEKRREKRLVERTKEKECQLDSTICEFL